MTTHCILSATVIVLALTLSVFAEATDTHEDDSSTLAEAVNDSASNRLTVFSMKPLFKEIKELAELNGGSSITVFEKGTYKLALSRTFMIFDYVSLYYPTSATQYDEYEITLPDEWQGHAMSAPIRGPWHGDGNNGGFWEFATASASSRDDDRFKFTFHFYYHGLSGIQVLIKSHVNDAYICNEPESIQKGNVNLYSKWIFLYPSYKVDPQSFAADTVTAQSCLWEIYEYANSNWVYPTLPINIHEISRNGMELGLLQQISGEDVGFQWKKFSGGLTKETFVTNPYHYYHYLVIVDLEP